MHNPFDLGGRLVLITGASSGIGRESAVLLSQLNARLVLVGRDPGRLRSTLTLLEGTGHRPEVFDLACTAEIGAWVKGLAEQEGPFAGLVHCAGMHAAAPLSVLSQQKIEQILCLNVTTAVLLAKAFRQKACCTRGASIVFLSSVAARAGSPGLSVYGASKAALAGLTKSLALELARDEIRVNCVLPGLVETEMTARLRQTLTPEQFQGIAAEHPLGIGSARDVAHAIAFLLAGTGRWITGSELIVDGGYTAH